MPANERIKLGIAPIAWTNDDMPELGENNTFEQCISEMAAAGFTGTEVGNKYPKEPSVLKEALDKKGLTVCNAWLSTFFTTKPIDATVEDFIRHRDFLHQMGAGVIGVSEQGNSVQGMMDVPVFEKKPVFSSKEWAKLTTGLNTIGRLAADKGMVVCYHHHMGTGVQTLEEIDCLMNNTDPSLVYLLFDTGHLVFSGENPEKVLEKYISRIKHVHLKDVRKNVLSEVHSRKLSFLEAVKAGVFTVPGDGMINFEPLFKALEQSKYTGWYVVEAEQDPAKANPLEYAVKARKYIKENAHI